MNEAKTQQRHGKPCGVKTSRVRKELNAASSVVYDNTYQFSMIVGGEEAAVKKWADMLHQSSMILDARESQRTQVLESKDLLKIQYVRQRLIRHVNIRDDRRHVSLPVQVSSIYFKKSFG